MLNLGIKILTITTILASKANVVLAENPFTKAFENVTTAGEVATSYPSSDLPTLIGVIISSVIGVLGVIALIIIIYEGFKIIFSKGDPEALKKAKNTFFYTAMGLIIIVLAYSITRIVIKSLV